MKEYFMIAAIVSIISIVKSIIEDLKIIEKYDLEGFNFLMLMDDLSEGFIIGYSWIISLPILCIKNIIFGIVGIISYILEKGERK